MRPAFQNTFFRGKPGSQGVDITLRGWGGYLMMVLDYKGESDYVICECSLMERF